MPLPKSAYHSRLYRNFQAISAQAPHSRIRFFEQYETAIRQLEEEEFFELLNAFADDLFRIGAYAKFKVVADELIACCMDNHILEYKGEDLFKSCIFRKGTACFHLMEYEQAVHLFQELIRMDPGNREAEKGLRRAFYRIKPGPVLTARALSVLVLFLAATVTAADLLYIRHFYAAWEPWPEYLRIGLFGLGVCTLLVSDVYQHRRAWKKARHFVRDAHARRAQR